MNSKTYNSDNQKVTEKIKKLCNVGNGVSEKDNVALSYIVEKTVRITSVTLMLADVLDNNDTLKQELQRSSIGLVKNATFCMRSMQHRQSLVQGLMDVVAILEVAQNTGLLSKMNTETLSNELIDLSEFIQTIDWHSGRRFTEDSFFGGQVPREVFSPEPFSQRKESYYGQYKDTQVPQNQTMRQESVFQSDQSKKDTETERGSQYKDRVQEIQKDRRATILGLVQKKDRITVKDVANVIKDCSQKTIQRELLALVKQGVLKKEGERRWSTYSLA